MAYINESLPRNAKVRLPHPRSGHSQNQETFLAPSPNNQTHNWQEKKKWCGWCGKNSSKNKKLIAKFRSEKHNGFTEEVNKVELSASDQTIQWEHITWIWDEQRPSIEKKNNLNSTR